MTVVNDTVRLAPGAFPGQAVVAWVGQRARRVDQDHPWLLDVGLTVVLYVFVGLPELLRGSHPDPGELRMGLTHPTTAATLVLQLGLMVPLLWRRRAPVVTFAVIAAVFVVQWSAGVFLRADFALLLALYGLALRGRPRQLFWASVAMVGPLVVVVVRVVDTVNAVEALFFLVSAVTAAVALGLVRRVRRAQLAGLRDRAARLELERDQRSRLAAATERTRVAREMHDIIGHNLSVIITLADAGAYAGETAPRRATEALRLVGDSGRQALGELRRMLGVLHDQQGEPELRPQPRIADVEALCARIRAAGPEIVHRSAGDLDTLDRGMQLMAYRIVQEALTNALRHAGPATRVTVSLTLDSGRLRILVRDTGPPEGSRSGPVEEGQGLAGMRERAALYAGTVTAGPTSGGGWLVEAVLRVDPGELP